jgi:hypothetical protein
MIWVATLATLCVWIWVSPCPWMLSVAANHPLLRVAIRHPNDAPSCQNRFIHIELHNAVCSVSLVVHAIFGSFRLLIDLRLTSIYS